MQIRIKVGNLRERIQYAKDELKRMNDALRPLTFRGDRYQFCWEVANSELSLPNRGSRDQTADARRSNSFFEIVPVESPMLRAKPT